MRRSVDNWHGSARPGVAMLLVMVTLALATIMAAALLSSSALRAQTAASASHGVAAAYLAESGMNMAMFYVQRPEQYPGSKPSGYYPGHTINLGADAPGTVTTSVTYNPTTRLYSIRSEASITQAGQTVTRRVNAVVEGQPVPPSLIQTPTDAITANGNLTVRSQMRVRGANGAVRTSGSVAVASGGAVEGAVRASGLTVSGGALISETLSNPVTAVTKLSDSPLNLVTNVVPTWPFSGTATPAVAPPAPADASRLVLGFSNMPDYRTYRWKDAVTGVITTYTAKKLTKSSYKNEVLGPTPDNPAGIYWTDSSTTLHSGVTVNGMIIVAADVSLNIGGANNFINAPPGLPGIVSAGALALEEGGQLGVNGLVYAQRIRGGSSKVKDVILKVAGGVLLADTGNPIATDEITGVIEVGHDSARANVPGFGFAVQNWQHQSLRIVSWSDR